MVESLGPSLYSLLFQVNQLKTEATPETALTVTTYSTIFAL
jgi:hypothetical protein